MKKIFNFLKYSIIILVGIIAIFLISIYVGHKYIFKQPYSTVSTIPDIKTDQFCFGVGCQPQVKTIDEYITLLANQIKVYNKMAPTLWPNNNVVNQFALVESIEHDKAWLIEPNGKISKISKKEINEIIPNRPRFNVGFKPIAIKDQQGIYLALSEADLNNVLTYQKYSHLGTYDLFITYSHELFHLKEQDNKWDSNRKIDNQSRDDKFENINARAKRNLIYEQILDAVTTEDSINKKMKILDVISSYNDYKKNYNEDFLATMYYDRIEGTAFYYELTSSLYSAYPNQVKNEKDLNNALKTIAKNTKAFTDAGATSEAYWIGGWTGVLLDQLNSSNKIEWKNQLINNSNTNPLEILAKQYANEKLPNPKTVTPEQIEQMTKIVDEKTNKSYAENIFRLLYESIF